MPAWGDAGIIAHSRRQTRFASLLLVDGSVKRGIRGTQFPDRGSASIGASFVTWTSAAREYREAGRLHAVCATRSLETVSADTGDERQSY